MWPILRAVGSVTLASGDVRVAIERAFDQQPTHALAAHVDRWLAREPELARVAHALGDCWPEEYIPNPTYIDFTCIIRSGLYHALVVYYCMRRCSFIFPSGE